MAILKVKDSLGEWKDVPQINGPTGPTGPTGPSVAGPTGPTGFYFWVGDSGDGVTQLHQIDAEVDTIPIENHDTKLVTSGGVRRAIDDTVASVQLGVNSNANMIAIIAQVLSDHGMTLPTGTSEPTE